MPPRTRRSSWLDGTSDSFAEQGALYYRGLGSDGKTLSNLPGSWPVNYQKPSVDPLPPNFRMSDYRLMTTDYRPQTPRRTPMQTMRYGAIAMAAVGSVGLGLYSWQTTPKEERSKAAQIDTPDTPRAEQEP
jgi:hypothetical protein